MTFRVTDLMVDVPQFVREDGGYRCEPITGPPCQPASTMDAAPAEDLDLPLLRSQLRKALAQ
jgi:hypothetical protein